MADEKDSQLQLVQSLLHLLGIAVALDTRFEQQDPARMRQALDAAARRYAASVREAEARGEKYGWRLARASDNAITKYVVQANPKTSDAMD